MSDEIRTSPLTQLVGRWEGDKGTDLAPKAVVDENNPYYETLTIEAIDMDLSNAEEQELVTVRYHLTVRQKDDNSISHSEAGFWVWDKNENGIMNTFSIPRGIAVVAGGNYIKTDNGEIIFNVSAAINNADWTFAQSPFLQKKAKTISFKREWKLIGNTLSYSQETQLEIYGKSFNHKDVNTLMRIE